jgi:DNA-binding MarR family transcriptional regulator
MNDQHMLDSLDRFNLLFAPGYLLRRNHQRSVDIFNRIVGDDITRQQFGTLFALHQQPGASQRDLVEATGVDKTTLKVVLGRLVKRGWVKRDRDREDTRAWTMYLTDEGSQLLLDRIEKVREAQAEILKPLLPEDRLILMSLLRTMAGLPFQQAE